METDSYTTLSVSPGDVCLFLFSFDALFLMESALARSLVFSWCTLLAIVIDPPIASLTAGMFRAYIPLLDSSFVTEDLSIEIIGNIRILPSVRKEGSDFI